HTRLVSDWSSDVCSSDLARLRRDPRDLIVRLLDEFGVEVVPFGDAHWKEAVDAYQRFGRGRHKAQLNFGDCLTYAVARLAGEPRSEERRVGEECRSRGVG